MVISQKVLVVESWDNLQNVQEDEAYNVAQRCMTLHDVARQQDCRN